MRLTIEPSSNVTSIDGIPFRIWHGTDENGTEVKVWVRKIQPQTHDAARLKVFDQQLQALPPLRPTAIDFRFVVD